MPFCANLSIYQYFMVKPNDGVCYFYVRINIFDSVNWTGIFHFLSRMRRHTHSYILILSYKFFSVLVMSSEVEFVTWQIEEKNNSVAHHCNGRRECKQYSPRGTIYVKKILAIDLRIGIWWEGTAIVFNYANCQLCGKTWIQPLGLDWFIEELAQNGMIFEKFSQKSARAAFHLLEG